MPILGIPSTLYFKEVNIIEFLKRYRDQCDNIGLKVKERIKRLPRYYSIVVG